MQNAGLDEAQDGTKVARRNINNLRYADDTSFMAESKEELKSLLMKLKEESEKAGLKLNIKKTKIMAFSPITSWQIDGGTMKTVTDFILLGSQITANGDYSHEVDVKTWLIGKDPDAGKDWSQEEKGMTEDEMVGWHHQFYGHEFEQTPGVGEGQGRLMCCSPWGCKELYMTEWLNWTDSSVVHAQLML